MTDDRQILDHPVPFDIDGSVEKIAAEFRAGFEKVALIDRPAAALFGSARVHEGSEPYESARQVGRLFAENGWAVVTGGGGGVMEGANRGAREGKGLSVGFNIVLPHEQAPNPYVTPYLSFQFHYFALRKMHFLLRARAVAVFPGGYGTFDEMFELLTLVQTGKVRPLPILLFGRDYWNRVVNFEAMVEEGVIAPHDLDLIHWSEDAEEAWQFITDFYAEHPHPAPVQTSPPE